MALVDLKLAPKPKQTMLAECCTDDESGRPMYPWGTSMTLNNETLAKVMPGEMPAVGKKVRIIAEATVTSASARQEADGDSQNSVDLQITAMEITPDAQSQTAASMLYNS